MQQTKCIVVNLLQTSAPAGSRALWDRIQQVKAALGVLVVRFFSIPLR